MTSEKQIAANRRNAMKSTGPRTPEGKRRVSRNALKHGLLSQELLIEGEDAEQFAAFRQGMLEQLEPEGELEHMLADRVIAAAWRLRRAVRMERGVVEEGLRRERDAHATAPGIFGDQPEPSPVTASVSTLCHTDTYSKLSRYEAHIERGLYRALHELQRRQAARRGHRADPPRALDVGVDVSGLPAMGSETDSAKQSHSRAHPSPDHPPATADESADHDA